VPIYEYECLSCGRHFDVLQKFSDKPITDCDVCKGTVRKLMGTPALQFKGTGWYITDYAGKSPKPSDANKKEAASAESKPAAAAPACPSGSCCGTKADKTS